MRSSPSPSINGGGAMVWQSGTSSGTGARGADGAEAESGTWGTGAGGIGAGRGGAGTSGGKAGTRVTGKSGEGSSSTGSVTVGGRSISQRHKNLGRAMATAQEPWAGDGGSTGTMEGRSIRGLHLSHWRCPWR